jgi:phosphoglycerate dehydrogenase-like enzyme
MTGAAGPDHLVLHPLHPPGLAPLLEEIEDVQVEAPIDSDGVTEALESGISILLTFLWEDRFLTESLRWVQAVSAGMEQFPAPALRDAGVRLTSARGAHAPAVAEHAIALLMAVVRGLGHAMRDVPQRAWAPRPAHEVAGMTLGVLGLGAIGEEVARRAVGLGMRVIGTKRSPEGYAGVAEVVLGPAGTIEVCRQADAVVIALPRAEETTHLVGAAELDALRGGWLVNVGRGSVVDEAALIDALHDGVVRGAGLDVFETEPLPADSALWDIPSVVITPHSAWSSDRLPPRIVEVFEQNRRAFHGEAEWATPVV